MPIQAVQHTETEKHLIDLLQRAYSGERAAAYAYQGHWKSLKSSAERQEIQQIEQDEWRHRQAVGELLQQLHAEPRLWLEIKMSLIGKSISWLCQLGGWLIPMYGAGRLEASNVNEYITAAEYAWHSAHPQMIPALLEMAELEWEHEAYFLSKIESHRFSGWLKPWRKMPPKASIRENFSRYCQAQQRAQIARDLSSKRPATVN